MRFPTRFATFSLTAVVLAGAVTNSIAEEPRVPSLIGFEALQPKLGSPGLRILDVRSREDYEKGHLPGAVWVDSKAVRTLTSKPGALTDSGAWTAWIAPLGITEELEVLISDGERQLDAARLWWLLRYLGVEKVGLIDGNVGLWKAEGRPLSTEVPSVKATAFPVRLRADRFANRDDVAAALKGGSAQVVDARSLAEYVGERKSSKRGGHIPTACRLEWSDLVDKNGRFLSKAELKAKVDGLGLKAGEPVITHCQGGGRASVDAFVLERLGFPARNYFLGWSDWGNAEETPIVEGEKAGEKPANR
ncbi:sulfurtransferase [Isosphaeraceae bacterium EP7]